MRVISAGYSVKEEKAQLAQADHHNYEKKLVAKRRSENLSSGAG